MRILHVNENLERLPAVCFWRILMISLLGFRLYCGLLLEYICLRCLRRATPPTASHQNRVSVIAIDHFPDHDYVSPSGNLHGVIAHRTAILVGVLRSLAVGEVLTARSVRLPPWLSAWQSAFESRRRRYRAESSCQ